MKYPNLRELRKLHNKKQHEVAAYLNMQQADYSKLEAGLKTLTLKIAKRLAAYYNVDVSVITSEQSIAETKHSEEMKQQQALDRIEERLDKLNAALGLLLVELREKG